MTLVRSQCSRVPFRPGNGFLSRRSCSASGGDPVRDGPPADLRLRLCQILARHGTERGKFAATSPTGTRCRTSCTVFCSNGATYLALPRLAWPGRLIVAMLVEGGWELLENFQLDHRALPHRHHLAGLFWRYHRQFGNPYALHGGWVFFAARKLPVAATVALGLVFEAVMLASHSRQSDAQHPHADPSL